jgi:hypothetical protein
LTKALSGTGFNSAPQATVNFDEMEARVEARALAKFERRLLDREHPNWQTEIALKDETGAPVKDAEGRFFPSPKFNEWMASKSEDFTKQFWSTDDSQFLGSAIKDYKSFRDTPANTPAPPPATPTLTPAPAAAQTSTKKARLAAAITPTGVGGKSVTPTLTEEQAMEAGFKSVASQRL